MKTVYAIDYSRNGEVLLSKTMEVDKENFHDMINLVDVIADRLMGFEFEHETTDFDVHVSCGNDVLFNNVKEYNSYLAEHKIMHRLASNFSLVTYVNDERYCGA